MDFPRAIRLSRAAFGLSQARFAKRLGISASQLSLLEAGKRTPSVRLVKRLSDELKVPESLIYLLALPGDEVRDRDREELARALLALIVAADHHSQPALPFKT